VHVFTVDFVLHALHTLVYCFSLLWPAHGVCYSHCLECFGWIAWLAWRAAGVCVCVCVCVFRVLGLSVCGLLSAPGFSLRALAVFQINWCC
jgi:hypothetical protein